MAPPLDSAGCALFIVAAFSLAGLAQAAWLGSPHSRRWSWPVDGGRTLRGRRLFGDNKTVRGFVVMVPATAAAFSVLSIGTSPHSGLWTLSPGAYAGVGALAGLGFMVGELPNSFLKRQLGIVPGCAASGRWAGPLFFVVDRLDSAAGALVALAITVPMPMITAAYVLLLGPFVHGAFSILTFRLGGKARAT